jgi:hypothetical protein
VSTREPAGAQSWRTTSGFVQARRDRQTHRVRPVIHGLPPTRRHVRSRASRPPARSRAEAASALVDVRKEKGAPRTRRSASTASLSARVRAWLARARAAVLGDDEDEDEAVGARSEVRRGVRKKSSANDALVQAPSCGAEQAGNPAGSHSWDL